MIRKTVVGALALFLGSAVTTPLSANAATFDLSGGFCSTGIATVDGIMLTASATGGSLSCNGSGVGVNGAGDISNLLEDGESITFSFDPSVAILESVFFEVGGGAQNVTITDPGNNVLDTFVVGSGGNNQNSFVTHLFASLTGSSFTFTTSELGGGNPAGNPGLRISSLDVAAVPLPGAAWLMLTGLAGFFGWKRRKRAGAPAAQPA